MTEFAPSPQRLRAFKALLGTLRILGLLVLLLTARRLSLSWGPLQALVLALLLAAGAAWLGAGGQALLQAASSRRVLIHEQALELRSRGFSRFVVFESLRHLSMAQGPQEQVLSLTLHTEDDSLRLAGFEGMGRLFSELAARKPTACLLEVEERKLDLGDPLPAAALAGLAAALAGWGLSSALGSVAEGRVVGGLLLANGLGLAWWRPVSRGGAWWAGAGEVALALLMAGFGAAMWVGS